MAAAQLPTDFETKSRERFNQIAKPELSFEQFLEIDKAEFLRQADLEQNPERRYRAKPLPSMTPCGNGDFETDIATSTQWRGAYGQVPSGGGTPNFSTFTAGIIGGAITNANSHQTWVGPGTDPNVGISTTAPGSSTHAVRIGNQATGRGCELLSKTFVVPSSQPIFCFWYAVVLQDPLHPPAAQPYFWVRVTDSTNTIVPGAINFGGTPADKLVADHTNPFFSNKGGVLYTDWRCAQINLTSQIGQTVTIEFITADCAGGLHYGYAYLDNFCGSCAGSPTGNFSFDASGSTSCGPGQLCFNYTLPFLGTTTGAITITLAIYQNGNVLTLLTSPTLTSGTHYCFAINPTSIPGINTALGGFDFAATGTFTLGTSQLGSMSVGAAPDGMTPGNNNDYQIACKWCCPGKSLLKNGDFEAGNSAFTSQYAFNAATTANATVPGQYNIVDSAHALAISPNWVVNDHFACIGGTGTSKFMVVNGLTCQSGSKVIWRETVAVAAWQEYRFCANAKHLPQNTFDITPKLEVKFTGVSFFGTPNIPPTLVSTGSAACSWQLFSGTVIPTTAGTMTIEIWLDETGLGDGNDLALDDISLQAKPAINPNYVLFGVTPKNITAGQYSVDAMPLNLPSGYGYFWEVTEVNNTNTPIPGTTVTNPSAWWVPFPCDFKGYVGTSALGLLSNPGVFATNKRYRITFGAWSDCVSWGQSSWYLQYSTALRKLEVIEAKLPAQSQRPPADRGRGFVRAQERVPKG